MSDILLSEKDDMIEDDLQLNNFFNSSVLIKKT